MAERQEALTRLAARDCIESVLQLRHPSAARLREALRGVDEKQRRELPEIRPASSRWWWAAAPPPPINAPALGSAAASVVAAEIWRQATAADLSPFDRLTFSVAGEGDVFGRLRFQVVSAEPVVIRPWIDFVLASVERIYYKMIGAEPQEIFTATVSAAVGRMRDVGVHLPTHAGPGAVEDAIGLHIDSFTEIISRATPEYLMDDLLRKRRFGGGPHSGWRLPLALARYGRGREAQQTIETLMAAEARRPHGLAFHELRWLSRRLDTGQS